MSDIQLRLYEKRDAPALLEAALESVDEVGPWLPWCHHGLQVEHVRGWIDSQIVEREVGTAYEFAVFDPAGRYVGACGVNLINQEHRYGNLGYWVRSSEAGKGITPLAVKELTRWAFAETKLDRLEIVCGLDNVRSQRVAEKVGAQREGVARSRLNLHGRSHNAVIYSIVRGDDV